MREAQQTIICERYGANGLHGTIFRPEVTKNGARDPESLGTMFFTDLRSAVILLALPNYQDIRKPAVAMMAEVSKRPNELKDILFSTHGMKDVESSELNAI